jgi:hypothetical protein
MASVVLRLRLVPTREPVGCIVIVVSVRNIHARPNPKYFGRRRGAMWLNMLSDRAVGLAGRVVSGTLATRCT